MSTQQSWGEGTLPFRADARPGPDGPFAALDELSAALGAPEDAAQAAACATAAALTATSAAACLLAVARPHGGLELHAASAGDARGSPISTLPEGEAELLAEVARDCRPRWSTPLATLGPSTALTCLPLSAGPRALGALAFAFAGAAEPDRSLLLAVARECARALDRALLAEEARAAGARLALLAEAGALLSSVPAEVGTLSRLAELTVPRLCDFAALDVVENGSLTRLAAAHRDPAKAWVLRELGRQPLPAQGPAAPPLQVALTGQAALYPELLEPALEAMAQDDREAALLRELKPISAVAVPILVRGKLHGVLSLGMSSSGRRHAPEDLPVAEELARRAAAVLEHAHLRGEADRESAQRRRAEEERERLLFELKEAVRVRDGFLSIASHELKTPLTALQLAIQSAERTVGQLAESDEREQALLRLFTAEKQVKRLTSLVDQLLDISRIQLGRLELEPHDVDLCALVREVVERAEHEFAKAGCQLTLRLPGPLWGRWDPGRLDQVLTNLVSNALKYGAGKPVRVEVLAEDGRARVTIADQGIGIAAEHQKKIFERFARAVSARQYSGFGLGLWIARQVLDALGGSIRVTSAPGSGSTFVVELPLQQSK